MATIVARVPPMYSACTTARSPLSAKVRMKPSTISDDEEEGDPQRRRHHPGGAVDPVLPAELAGRGLLEPLVVARLLDRGLERPRPERAEHGRAPRVELVVEGAVLHLVPLDVDDPAGVADELAREVVADVGREPLRGLHLLRDGQRLGLGSAPRGVVALEGEEDQEAEQHGEPGGDHPEDAGGPVAVGDEPALRRPAAHGEHAGDRDAATTAISRKPTRMFTGDSLACGATVRHHLMRVKRLVIVDTGPRIG